MQQQQLLAFELHIPFYKTNLGKCVTLKKSFFIFFYFYNFFCCSPLKIVIKNIKFVTFKFHHNQYQFYYIEKFLILFDFSYILLWCFLYMKEIFCYEYHDEKRDQILTLLLLFSATATKVYIVYLLFPCKHAK